MKICFLLSYLLVRYLYRREVCGKRSNNVRCCAYLVSLLLFCKGLFCIEGYKGMRGIKEKKMKKDDKGKKSEEVITR